MMRYGWDKEHACIIVIWEDRDLKPYKGPVRHVGRSLGWGTGSDNPASACGSGPRDAGGTAETETE